MVVRLVSDKVRVSGPRVDGTYTVTFEVGEYEKVNVTRVMLLPEGTYEVEVKRGSNKSV